MRTFPTVRHWDQATSLYLNRINHAWTGGLFAVVSRLGDGWAWFALIIALPGLFGWRAGGTALLMLANGAVCTALYKWMKQRIHRPRPCEAGLDLHLTVAPLDRFSFPSGHTLHAVSFTIVACSFHPVLAWVLAPFTVLVAMSRLVLGLHYPSDVLVGAALGGLVAAATVALAPSLGMGQ